MLKSPPVLLLACSLTTACLAQQQRRQTGSEVLTGAVSNTRRLLVSEQDRLTTVTIATPGAEPAKYVAAGAVERALSAGKFSLVERLDHDELGGVRAYASRYYPSAPRLRIVRAETHNEPLTPTLDASAAFADANSFLGRIEGIAMAPVDLQISTEPPEATFHLEAEYGGVERTTVSDGPLKNVYRGLYVYRVIRNGFKPVQGNLNLVDEDGTTIVCKLVPADSAEAAQPCAVR